MRTTKILSPMVVALAAAATFIAPAQAAPSYDSRVVFTAGGALDGVDLMISPPKDVKPGSTLKASPVNVEELAKSETGRAFLANRLLARLVDITDAKRTGEKEDFDITFLGCNQGNLDTKSQSGARDVGRNYPNITPVDSGKCLDATASKIRRDDVLSAVERNDDADAVNQKDTGTNVLWKTAPIQAVLNPETKFNEDRKLRNGVTGDQLVAATKTVDGFRAPLIRDANEKVRKALLSQKKVSPKAEKGADGMADDIMASKLQWERYLKGLTPTEVYVKEAPELAQQINPSYSPLAISQVTQL